MLNCQKKIILFLPCFILLYFTTLPASQKKIAFDQIYIGEESSLKGVNCIFQDSKGFMWFGTNDGLLRFNGYKSKVFRHDPTDSTSISGDLIRFIQEDRWGTLWIGTSGSGLNRFDRKTEQFIYFRFNPQDSNSISSDFIESICEDPQGRLWIGTRQVGSQPGGLNRLALKEIDIQHPRSVKFVRYVHHENNPNSLSNNIIRVMLLDSKGVLWIGTEQGGLNKLVLRDCQFAKPEKVKFTRYNHDPQNPNSLSHHDVRAVFEDVSGTLWIGTGAGGLNKFDRKAEKFIHFPANPDDPKSLNFEFIEDIIESPEGILWVGTWGRGLKRFDMEKGIFDRYKSDPMDLNSLSNNFISCLYQDRAGSIWIGTKGGVNKINWRKTNFVHYQNDPKNPNSLANNCVNAICEDVAGLIWLGTNDGLDSFDRKTGKFTHYKNNPRDPNTINHNYISTVYEDRRGIIWIATEMGLEKLDRTRKKFVHFQYYFDVTHKNVLRAIYEDNSGLFWFGTLSDGLICFDQKTNQRTYFKKDIKNQFSLSSNAVRKIYEDATGIFWIGDNTSVVRFDKKRGRFQRHNNVKNGIGFRFINSILEDPQSPEQFLWIAYREGGLCKFDRINKSFVYYSQFRSVFSMLLDEHDNLWLSSNRGLSRFNTQTEALKDYGEADGMTIQSFQESSCCKSKKTGEMLFGGINGFIVFHPDSIKDNRHIPPIVITDFKIFNQPVKIDPQGSSPLRKSITETKEIQLPFNQNTLSFEFAALDYQVPQKNQYSYKMEGLDENWISSGNRRFVNYTKLAPGEYTFRVIGCNNDGIWNNRGAAIHIVIRPPWWKKSWAYVFYILILAAFIIGLWRFQVRRIHLRNELKMRRFETQKLQEIDKMKSRFFANISHEFRTPLTLILGPLEQFLADKFYGDPRSQYRLMYRYGRRLLLLINQLLDLSKLEAGQMTLQAQATDVVQFVKALTFSFISWAERKGIELQFTSQQDSIITYADRDKLEKIVTNLLSNAIKFTPSGGKITVATRTVRHGKKDAERLKNQNTVEIKIKDSGVGMKADVVNKIFDRFYQIDDSPTKKHAGSGIGLALTKELVELHRGEISVESEQEKGTTFCVYLPLGKQHLSEKEITEAVTETQFEFSNESDFVLQSEEKAPSGGGATLLRAKRTAPLVLIVEDNQDVRNYIRGHLLSTYRIIEAGDGVEGLSRAIEKIPDLIISDVMMPRMDGFEMCRKIKTDQRTSHIPVILLTARASEKSKVRGLETGADDYLTKPFNVAELSVRVKNLIEQRRKLRERFIEELTLLPRDLAITSTDEKFLKKVNEIMKEHLSDAEFDTHALAWQVGMSRMQLHRKLCALTNHAPREFIRVYRLKRAAQLFDQQAGNITEVAYEVGFSNISHFAKRFRQLFGKSPSEYLAEKR